MSIKLYYFDGKARAEPIRWILAYGNIEYEDVRAPVVGFPPTLPPEFKAKGNWGQVPVLEIEGKTIAQSTAICRYLAKKANLVPEGLYEQALCDEYVDSIKDMMQGMYAVIKETAPEKKEQVLKEVTETTKTKYLNVFEKLLKKNDGKHLVGKTITWADIILVDTIDQARGFFGIDFLTSEYPCLKSQTEMVKSTPGIKDWLDRRPNTKF